jgi:hypothetical protein
MDDKYLKITATLIAFFCIVIFYLKNKKSPFGDTQIEPLINNIKAFLIIIKIESGLFFENLFYC